MFAVVTMHREVGKRSTAAVLKGAVGCATDPALARRFHTVEEARTAAEYVKEIRRDVTDTFVVNLEDLDDAVGRGGVYTVPA